jgi:hypothetical protein
MSTRSRSKPHRSSGSLSGIANSHKRTPEQIDGYLEHLILSKRIPTITTVRNLIDESLFLHEKGQDFEIKAEIMAKFNYIIKKMKLDALQEKELMDHLEGLQKELRVDARNARRAERRLHQASARSLRKTQRLVKKAPKVKTVKRSGPRGKFWNSNSD